jgi:hypothetical protein
MAGLRETNAIPPIAAGWGAAAIADEVNAQLLQSLSGYENEKPAEFPRE